ncbi:Flagellar hook-basal body complex protein fliE [Ralstonia solanacearum CMR15]|nr:Flagellar hook-basal body complex protein fliE [Ralstonia solanacearum CMR15]
MTEAIQALAQAGNSEAVADLQASPAAAAPVAGMGFGDLVSQGLEGVNQQLLVSQKDLQQLATGNAESLHQVMIRLEESRLSFQLLLQVRNRLLEAYQDVMKMQV